MKWLFFVLGAILCWGAYGPALHAGQVATGNPVKALLWVGFAYFLVAVMVPIVLMKTATPPIAFNLQGAGIATFAGILGAGGAVCILLSFRAGASPLLVMPLVFGAAPAINTIISMIQHPPEKAPNPLLYVGFALAALGGFMTLYFKPAGAAPVKKPVAAAVTTTAGTPPTKL